MNNHFDKQKITFRPLVAGDLKLLFKWLRSSHVHEFYDKDKEITLDNVSRRYLPKIKGEKPTDCFYVLYDNKPVGYIQKYFIKDWEDWSNILDYDDSVESIDLFLGDKSYIGKGFGSLMLSEFLNQVVFVDPKIKLCVIGPEPSNTRAIHVYEKVGFKYIKTVRLDGDTEDTYLMELNKVNSDKK